MRNLISNFKNYLLSKETRTNEENALLEQCEIQLYYFPISYISRDDLIDVVPHIDNVGDDMIENVADKMGDYYGNNGFYEDLVDAVSYYQLR